MDALTCAELRRYPGSTFTEQLEAHHREVQGPAPAAPPVVRPKRLAVANKNGHGTLAVAQLVDLRPFPGRDRVERMANYLRSHLPRTESWNEDSLRECAARLLVTTDTFG